MTPFWVNALLSQKTTKETLPLLTLGSPGQLYSWKEMSLLYDDHFFSPQNMHEFDYCHKTFNFIMNLFVLFIFLTPLNPKHLCVVMDTGPRSYFQDKCRVVQVQKAIQRHFTNIPACTCTTHTHTQSVDVSTRDAISPHTFRRQRAGVLRL